MNHKTGDLETWFTPLDSIEFELEMPLTRSHTVLEFDHEINLQYLSQIAIIVYLF